MKRIFTIILIALILVTGCNKKDKNNEGTTSTTTLTSTTTTTTSSSTTMPTTSISELTTTTSTSTTKKSTTKATTTKTTTTKKNYPATINGKGYDIGDTVVFKLYFKSKYNIGYSNIYFYLMKKCNASDTKFDYLDDDLDVSFVHNIMDPVVEDPDQEITKTGYCGHGYRSDKAVNGYMQGTTPEVIDFSKQKLVLTLNVKIKKSGEYLVSFDSNYSMDINNKKIPAAELIFTQDKK